MALSSSCGRVKDKFLLAVEQAEGGCLFCGAREVVLLPGPGARLGPLFCERHVRWALAARRERVGRQARTLKKLLLAWCRLRNGDEQTARKWLGY